MPGGMGRGRVTNNRNRSGPVGVAGPKAPDTRETVQQRVTRIRRDAKQHPQRRSTRPFF